MGHAVMLYQPEKLGIVTIQPGDKISSICCCSLKQNKQTRNVITPPQKNNNKKKNLPFTSCSLACDAQKVIFLILHLAQKISCSFMLLNI